MRQEDSLSLGTDRYLVDTKAVFAAIDKAVPKTADIRPLSKVWEDHEEYILNQKIKSARFVAIASSMGLLPSAPWSIPLCLEATGSSETPCTA